MGSFCPPLQVLKGVARDKHYASLERRLSAKRNRQKLRERGYSRRERVTPGAESIQRFSITEEDRRLVLLTINWAPILMSEDPLSGIR